MFLISEVPLYSPTYSPAEVCPLRPLTGVPRSSKIPTPLGPYCRPMLRVLEGSQGGGRFLMSEVPLYGVTSGPP